MAIDTNRNNANPDRLSLEKRKFGGVIEAEVQEHLEKQGLLLLQKNFTCKMGEIDLIMQDHKSLVFVEVRYRKNDIYGSAAESVTRRKQRRIIRAAQLFLLKHPSFSNCPCRFDVVSVQPTLNTEYNTIHWIKNAFEAYS